MLDVLIAVEHPAWRREFQAVSRCSGDVRLWFTGPDNPQKKPAVYDVIVIGSVSWNKQLVLEKIAQLRKRYADPGFVLIADCLEWFTVAELWKEGVYGFLDAGATRDQILSAISAASRNDLYVSSSLIDRMASATVFDFGQILYGQDSEVADISKLSERELETLKLVAKGMSNKDIARHLFISEKTVKNHLYNIYKKLGVRDRTQAVIAVIKAMRSTENGSFGPI